MSFSHAMEVLLGPVGELGGHEGDGAAGPDDPGGETRFGFAKNFLPRGEKLPQTRAQAVEMYERLYWKHPQIRCDKLDPISGAVAEFVFDMTINPGPGRSGKLLQSSLVMLGYAGVTVDGVVGPQTRAAVKQRVNKGSVGEEILLSTLIAMRAETYLNLVRRNRKRTQWLGGWLLRTMSFAP